MLSIPFSIIGSVWLLFILNYNFSVAVWIGIIALAGVAAETGIVMLVYLNLAYEQLKDKIKTKDELDLAIIEGAVKRLRPKMMTFLAIIMGLIPIMWSDEPGADVMKRIAAPMIGGMISSAILTLIVIPAIYKILKGRHL